MAEGSSKRKGGVMQNNSGSEARDRGEPASTDSTKESRYDRRAKGTMGVQDKLCIRKVADTGYSREERERRQDGGARKSRVTHATEYTCRKNMRGHRGRKSKSRQRRGRNWLKKK
jgi:hypothetical protein